MSVEGDLFRVTVKGSRESVVKMMNAALKSFNSDYVIAESDDVETMNAKLELFTGREGKGIGIPDLSGQAKEEDSFARRIEFVRIEDDSPGLVAKFSYYLGEECLYLEDMGYPADYLDSVTNWETIALQYDCTVFLDDDWYSNGRRIRFGAATIYDPSDGEIRRIHLESGSIYDAEDYPIFLKTLAHLYPDHYGADWDDYHSNHPEVEISEEECLAWFHAQKQPWQQDQPEDSDQEEVFLGSLSHLIDGNGHAVIPEGTTRIDDFTFMNCDKLVSVSIPETVEEIGEGAFGGCENLKSVVLPGSLQRIESRAFADCISLKDIDIPPGITVDAEAFMNCPRESVLSPQTMEKTILGTGIFNLDIIVVREYPEWPAMRPFVEKEALREVGGTCGNVMCMLATLGWKVRPVACLDDSAEGWKITEDLKTFGCDCTYVSNTPGGGTTLLRCTHKKDADGKHVMSVRTGSPGGSRFPKRHFLRARDEAPAFLAALKDASSVFFFDDPAAGNRALAKGLKERGALVYFEPFKIASNADLEAVGLSDIIKFSDENVPDVSFADAFPDKVFIQTMGPDGVKIKEKGGAWYVIEGVKNNTVVDAEGAGDTFTSAFINALADGKTVADAAREAMMMASRSVGFLGSKGIFRR